MNQLNLRIEPLDFQTEEAYKALRANLQFCGADKKAIVLTSCTPNEGKSNASLQLALSLAKSGKKTALIDADMRKSVLLGSIYEGSKEVLGLSHYLSGQNTLQDVLYSTNILNFYTIFSGPFPPNPAELLGGELFEEMLETLKKVCDYIIIDTPPIGRVIDAAVVAGKCDGAVLLIESGAISYRFAQEVKEQLERTGCPMLGAILNKVDPAEGYGKYGKYGKYRKYGKYGKYGSYDAYGHYGEHSAKSENGGQR